MYQEVFYLVDEDNKILDRTCAGSVKQAEKHFNAKGWVSGEVISEGDWLHELELNQLEMQPTEQ